MNAHEIIKLLGLEPHAEGGFYKETCRSDEKIPHHALPARYQVDKHLYTAIYYLLTPDTISALHRIQTDELFHFYLGDPVSMLWLCPDGCAETKILGNDIAAGQLLQCLVPKGVWQGMCLVEGGRFALMGTTMAPGFDFHDFELGNRGDLIKNYPHHAHLIERFTIKDEC